METVRMINEWLEVVLHDLSFFVLGVAFSKWCVYRGVKDVRL